ncbi:MAG: hypothetical protein MK052_10980 [Alphaproteobacteria bacterium]|nr:hypothetical protein [Alphaproteobacteria bacterium]
MTNDPEVTQDKTINSTMDKARMRRLIGLLAIGIVSLIVFYYLANGVTSLLAQSTAVDSVQ